MTADSAHGALSAASPVRSPGEDGPVLALRVTVLRTGSQSTETEFRGSSVRLGRHPNNDVVIADPRVSSYHGEISLGARGVIYRDLRSTNGSVLRRGAKLLRIDAKQPSIALEDGDDLLFGDPAKAVVVRIGILAGNMDEVPIACDIEETLDIAESLQVTTNNVLAELSEGAERVALLALHRFSNLAAGEHNLKRLLQHFAGSVFSLSAKAERLAVYLQDSEDGEFLPAYTCDRNQETTPEPLSRTLKDLVLGRGRAVLFSISDPELKAAESLFDIDIVSGICAPIWNGEEVIGMALVDSRLKNSAPFGVDDLKWITLLSRQVALSIDNARLTANLMQTVDELTCAQAEMEQLVFFDPLTGLHNRRLFRDRLEQAVRVTHRTRKRFALLYLDLDDFKQINDTLGHDAGDTLLCAFGDRLLACVRNEDTVARIGGDEFAILMSEVAGIEGAQVVARKVLDELRAPVNVGDHALHVSASIGITIAPDDGEDAETLLKNADLALYRAKKRGRDTFQFFVEDMNKEIADRLFLQRELWAGLEQGHFVQHFQPVWRLHDSSLVGAEALTRWQHPTHGLLLPERFIGLAEESELIDRIGECAIVNACEHLARLRRAGRERVKISINLSARQFRGGELASIFRRALHANGVDGADLEVEITETMLMKNIHETRATLEQLKALDISVAIDDFGTGYCSLSYLKDLPIDILKVDRSFVQRVETSRDDAEIVAAVIAMAHKLQMKVVAEGIESEGQLEFLRANGCDMGQGYLFGKPTSFQSFMVLVPPRGSAVGGVGDHRTRTADENVCAGLHLGR